MRIVIDSNSLQSDELWAFLRLSPDHQAVLTDYAAMEAFKANKLVSIQESWKVLRQFPKQIVMLKGTKIVGTLEAQAPGIASRLISKPDTKEIPIFASLLERAAAGDRHIIKQLLQRGEWARSHMDWMLDRSGDMALSIEEFRAPFDDAELRRFRKDEPWTPAMGAKFRDLVLALCQISFKAHPSRPRMPSRWPHLINHFLFRHAFTYAIYMLQLVQDGAVTRKAVKARNDAVDVIFATYATYFNGLMSRDELGSKVHMFSRAMLSAAGARVPVDYMDGYALEIATYLDDNGEMLHRSQWPVAPAV
ncbi:hypothetical protein [Sphingomonas koreensis]